MATKISATPRLPLRISSHSLMSFDIQSNTLIASPIAKAKLMAATTAHARLRAIWNRVIVNSLPMDPPFSFEPNRIINRARRAGEARQPHGGERIGEAARHRRRLERRLLHRRGVGVSRRQPAERERHAAERRRARRLRARARGER